MKKIEIFDGASLHEAPVPYQVQGEKCALLGTDAAGHDVRVPIDENLLSRHMMLLGGIGTLSRLSGSSGRR